MSEWRNLAARSMADAQDREFYRMAHGWNETLPRTFWQRLFRRPATVVHHEGFGEL